MGIPKDKWENQKLLFVPAELDAITRIIIRHRTRWVSYGVAAVVICLFQLGYTQHEIHESFARAESEAAGA
jgi:hypothetical protein